MKRYKQDVSTRITWVSFDDQRADVVRNNLTAQADDLGQFNDPTDQVKSDAFLAKF